jgi:hypothetical protein
MAHHSDQPFGDFNPEDLFRKSMQNPQREKINELMAEAMQQKKMGPTGKFPDGKLNDTDEGEIQVGIAEVDGRVVMNFGKPIEWIGFTKEQAKQIGFSLHHKAGFSQWDWMKKWLDAWEKANPESGVTAYSIISWMNQQPTTAG